MPTRPIQAGKLQKEVAQLHPVQLDLPMRIAPMSIAGSRRKLRTLPASVIATQHQPLLLPAQALRVLCSITLAMENRCPLSSATFFSSPAPYSSARRRNQRRSTRRRLKARAPSLIGRPSTKIPNERAPPPSRAGSERRTTVRIVTYIFEENHRFSN
jgi:hypothetical protein